MLLEQFARCIISFCGKIINENAKFFSKRNLKINSIVNLKFNFFSEVKNIVKFNYFD